MFGKKDRSLITVVAVGSAVALSLFGDMAMYVILPVHFAELGLTALQVGVLLSANRWVRLLTNRVAERMLRLHSSTVLFPAALLLGSLLTAAYSTASIPSVPTFLVLLALRLVWGLCWSFIRHTGVMTTVGVSGSGRAGRSMGIYVALVQAGFVAGTFVAGVLFDGTGFQTTFLLAAALSLSALLAAVIGRRRTRVSLNEQPSSPPRVGRNVRSFMLAARGFVVSLVGAGLIMSTLGFLLRSWYGETIRLGTVTLGVATLNGILLAAQYLINSVGSPFFGIVIDRQGPPRAQVLGFAAAGAALLGLALLQSTAFFIPLVMAFFISAAVSRLAVESEAAVGGPRAYSRLATATDLGSAVGPVLGWIGIELSQSGVVFWAGGLLFVIGAGFAAIELQFMHDRRR